MDEVFSVELLIYIKRFYERFYRLVELDIFLLTTFLFLLNYSTILVMIIWLVNLRLNLGRNF